MTATISKRLLTKALDRSGHHAVVIIGHKSIVPRRMGDNQGGRGIRIVVTKDPATAHRVDDQRSAFHEIVVLAVVWCGAKREAEGLSTALETEFGRNKDVERARHTWFDLDPDFDVDLLSLLIGQAQRASGIQILSEQIHQRRQTQLARQIMQEEMRA